MNIPARRSSFCLQLASKNNLDLKEWLFYPGMLFGDKEIWWGDRGMRVTPHEGLDLYRYRSICGSIQPLAANTQIPVLYGGQIARIVDDFLGKTIFVKHPWHEEKNRELYSIYGHVRPEQGLSAGMHLHAGDVLGCIAAPRNRASTSAPPPHLHLSVALISKTFPPERLGWKIIASEEKILFMDPLPLIDCAYGIRNPPLD